MHTNKDKNDPYSRRYTVTLAKDMGLDSHDLPKKHYKPSLNIDAGDDFFEVNRTGPMDNAKAKIIAEKDKDDEYG